MVERYVRDVEAAGSNPVTPIGRGTLGVPFYIERVFACSQFPSIVYDKRYCGGVFYGDEKVSTRLQMGDSGDLLFDGVSLSWVLQQ